MRRKKNKALILTPPRVVIEKKSKAMYSYSEISLGSLRDQTGGLVTFDVIAAVSATS